MTDSLRYEGRFLHFVDRHGWEFVRRANASAVVAIAARTVADEVVLIEQLRHALGPAGRRVIEVPAGLVGDDGDHDVLAAAERELLEEAGYRAGSLRLVGAGPSSAGLTDELITFVIASDLDEVGAGGGVDGEDIVRHCVPWDSVDQWLTDRLDEGYLVDPKVWAALWLLR